MLGPEKFRHMNRYRKISDFFLKVCSFAKLLSHVYIYTTPCYMLHYTVLHVLAPNLALKFANKFKLGAAQCETKANIPIVTRVVAIFTNFRPNCYLLQGNFYLQSTPLPAGSDSTQARQQVNKVT